MPDHGDRPPRAPRRPVRIMIVEDSATVVRGLMGALDRGGIGLRGRGRWPRTGRIALDLVDAAQPDIVLLDLDMPVLDGVATLPLLLRRRPGLSVVVVSTLTQRNAVISLRCLSAGAVDYLPKAVQPDGSVRRHDGLPARAHRRSSRAWPPGIRGAGIAGSRMAAQDPFRETTRFLDRFRPARGRRS